jgi:8-amino-7-oxononanoate synthase
MIQKGIHGLTAQLKDKLIQQALERRFKQSNTPTIEEKPPSKLTEKHLIPEQYYRFNQLPGYQQLCIMNDGATRLGIESPFFKLHNGCAGATSEINNQTYINFASYNYLGLSGHPETNRAAKEAIDLYGTSASASRMVAGERPIHRKLEQTIANAYGVQDAVVFVSGHATNVTTIGYLFGSKDLIVHDELVHNSILEGITLSGAKRLPFAHNNSAALDELLIKQRHHFERVLIVIEGIYSMDGDYPNLPEFVDLKNKHKTFLMVDEAHSFGVMGETGLGIRQHFNLKGSDIDIWMGTLSKAFAGCGGYIAGETALIENLKCFAPGFLYSVGMSPPLAAASLTAVELLQKEPERVHALQQRGEFFLKAAQAVGINTGTSSGLAVIPAIVGSSVKTVKLSAALFNRGINVQPILYPAVPEKSARLRFFISCHHTEEQIKHTITLLAEEINRDN